MLTGLTIKQLDAQHQERRRALRTELGNLPLDDSFPHKAREIEQKIAQNRDEFFTQLRVLSGPVFPF
jgi:hypothetical protein